MKDNDGNGTPDMLEVSRFALEQTGASRQHALEMQKLANDRTKLASERSAQLQQLVLEKEKLKVKREEIASKERIAKKNKNRFD